VVLDGAVTHRPVGVIELGVEPVGGISRDLDGARVAVIGLAAELSVALEADERGQAVLPCPTGPPRVETAGMASDGGRRVSCGSSTEHLAARQECTGIGFGAAPVVLRRQQHLATQ